MKSVFFPVYKLGVGYSVSFGRRWTLLEHMLLVDLSRQRQTVRNLAASANVSERLVVEALINLLRQGWIEVRTTEDGIFFTATAAGKRRTNEESLPVELQRRVRWISLCFDRLTGSWLRAGDLEIVHDRDLPPNAKPLEPTISTYEAEEGNLRELVYLGRDESFERFEPNLRAPSRLYARVEIAFGKIDGLPPYAPPRLRMALLENAADGVAQPSFQPTSAIPITPEIACDELKPDDVIVGGAAHLSLLKEALASTKTHCIIHSCFVQSSTVEKLLPDLEAAARRKVRVDLLWGLREDPETKQKPESLSAVEAALDKLRGDARTRVQLSPVSSRSHAKALVFDDIRSGGWQCVIGSCNFLSSYFDSVIEISLRSRSLRLISQILGQLITGQLPASGGWSPTARRLNRAWNEARRLSAMRPDRGDHVLTLLADDDHYACVTMARDQSVHDIILGCDLYGAAAETSVMVPMHRAAQLGRRVRLLYRRPSRRLQDEGRVPDPATAQTRGIALEKADSLHGKFLLWDDAALAVTSFNWLATIVDGTRAHGAELGVLVKGPSLRDALAEKLKVVSGQAIDLGRNLTIGSSAGARAAQCD